MRREKDLARERSVVSVAFANVLSRIAGFARDSAVFALLAMTPWSGAFLFAFTVPNLFRRLLGEGALGAALVPLFGAANKSRSREEAFAFLNGVLARMMFFFLAAFAAIAVAFAGFHKLLSESWLRATALSVLLFPYLAFACLSAALCGALNVLGLFGLPALGALLLNASVVVFAAVAFAVSPAGGRDAATLLCCGVLVGGFLQLALPALLLARRGWRFRPTLAKSDLTHRFAKLFFPATAAAAIVQINGALSRILAFCLEDGALAVLYLSSRLVELPLGIFVAPILTVAFPALSGGSGQGFAEAHGRAVRSLLMVAVPSAVGLCVLGEPILDVLFNWGNCGMGELTRVLPVLRVSAAALPFFALSGLWTRAFHGKCDTVTPLKIAAISLVANVALTLALAGPFSALGIGAANAIAALLQCVLLAAALGRKCGDEVRCGVLSWGPKIAAAAMTMWAVILACQAAAGFFQPGKTRSLFLILAAIPAGAAAYCAVLRALKFEEVSLLLAMAKLPGRPFSR
ncbi:MAG: murein biosynthesis integral membrane protein MurJ [Puniceicoccales bacterium]|nr:murein biosynthesis integral membrane protein MurJ [Puniceicoccales bacterium]